MRQIADSTFAVVANGTADQPPASGLHEFLRAEGARKVTTIFHPLEPEDEPYHEITVYERGRRTRTRRVPLPSKPPYTFALDPLVPLWPERVDGWFAFNNLAAARGLLARRLGRAGKVVYWAVDFVPDRFGTGALTRLYDSLDAYCCRTVDGRIELSQPALSGRNERHGLTDGAAAPAQIVPIGVWLQRVPHAPEDALAKRRIVFIGHLVKRQGVGLLLEALQLLDERGAEFECEIAGHGPLAEELRADAQRRGLDSRVRFVGFLDDHRDVEAFLAGGTVAVAPYDPTGQTFTRYADPSKLKSYLAAGLPILTTDVPPNAEELVDKAGAEIFGWDPEALAGSIERLLADEVEWQRRRAAALHYIGGYDWANLLAPALERIGFFSSRRNGDAPQ